MLPSTKFGFRGLLSFFKAWLNMKIKLWSSLGSKLNFEFNVVNLISKINQEFCYTDGD